MGNIPGADSSEAIRDTDLILTLRPGVDEPLPQAVSDVKADILADVPDPPPALTDAEIATQYERNANRNAYTDAEKAQVATLASPIRAVGLLQWAVTPTLLDGRAAADIETVFRLEFETPHLQLSHLYFEVWIENRRVHARRQWADVSHLDVAIGNADAVAIAGALAAARTSLNLELVFYAGAAGGNVVAATARRVQIVEADGGDSGEGQTETQVKALIRAGVLDQAETGNADPWQKSKLPADTVYDDDLDKVAIEAIGRVEVNPGRIRDAADLDGTYECIVLLTGAEQSRLQAAGVNYLEMWFGTETVHVVSPWAPALATRVDAVVDTTEETQIGAGVNVYPVRAVYRISDGGSQEYYAEGSGALRVAGYSEPDEGDTWNAVEASSAGGLNSEFVAHRLTNSALLITITANFRTATRSYVTGQRWYLAPHQSSELFMVLVSEPPGEGGSGTPLLLKSDAQAAATNLVRNAWTTVGTLTIPAGDAPGDVVLFFEATATRTQGAGTISVRLRRNADIIKASAAETEISGAVEHKPLVVMAVDTPGTDADAVYTVQAFFSADNLAANVGASQFIAMGGTTAQGQTDAEVKAAIAEALPPFADIRLLPEAVPGSQVPDDFYVELAGKLTSREIDGLTLLIAGQTIQPHASTPVAGFDTETQALVRFDVSAVADAIANGIDASDRELRVDLTFSFTEGDDFTRRIILPVNNPNAPRLVQGELDSIAFNAALTLDWLAPDMRTVTLTGDVTFSFSNIQVGRPLVVEVIQGGAGGHGITWPASVEWADKTKVGPSAAAGAVDRFFLLPFAANKVQAAALLNTGPSA